MHQRLHRGTRLDRAPSGAARRPPRGDRDRSGPGLRLRPLPAGGRTSRRRGAGAEAARAHLLLRVSRTRDDRVCRGHPDPRGDPGRDHPQPHPHQAGRLRQHLRRGRRRMRADRPGHRQTTRYRLTVLRRRIARDEETLSAKTTSGVVLGRPARWSTGERVMIRTKTGWFLVVGPPRERPRAWSGGSARRGPFDGPGGVLVGAGDRGVDPDDPVEVAFGVLGQVRQRRPGAVLERDHVHHLPVITPPPTPPRCPIRQQRLDPRPPGVSQRHASTDDPMIRRGGLGTA